MRLSEIKKRKDVPPEARTEEYYMNRQETYDIFKQPGNAYRGKPFWSWNGELDEKELIRQVGVMRKMGFGGFFMHSRSGLIT